MTGILEQLKWTTQVGISQENRLILLYKGLKGKARIPADDLTPPKTRRYRKPPKIRRCRNNPCHFRYHLLVSIEAYKL